MTICRTYRFLYLSLLMLLSNACVESIELDSISFESALVVEATLTNELKQHKINLSRVFRLEEDGIHPEGSAEILVTDQNQNEYRFVENEPGTYVSETLFRAENDNSYQLFITTSDGRTYSSTPTAITGLSKIDELKVTKELEEAGEFFVIGLSTFDSSGSARYFRYEFEETYQIIPPYWSPYDAVVVSTDPPQVDLVDRIEEERVCYATNYSNAIIQTETTGFIEDRVSNFPVRKIGVGEFIASHRYSILVKQYVQSAESYTFYKLLNSFADTGGNILSQNQPGFFEGNIASDENVDEKVVGFFDVCAVDFKRVYFNYRDFFEGGRPPYLVDCNIQAPALITDEGDSPLIGDILSGNYTFGGINLQPNDSEPGPYLMVENACSDCTELGTNIRPDFWED